MAEASTRSQVRTWIRSQIAGQSHVEVRSLYREMVAHFAGNPDFVSAWLAETLPAIAYEETRRVCADTRDHILFGDEILNRDATEERMREVRPRWQAWLEHVGDRHVRLMDMNSNELRTAATIRRTRGENELRIAELWDELASKLKGKKKVSDVFTPEQIEDLAANLSISVNVRRQIIIREDLAA